MITVIVNGQGRAGKDTFEQMVQKIGTERGYIVKKISTIDYVKQAAEVAFGWDGGKTNEDRRFLSDLKDALTRWKDVPYQIVKENIEASEKEGVDLLFIDCREPAEIERFVKDYQSLTLYVKRGKIINIGNHADDDVENYSYDIYIDNSRGLEELMQEAVIFVETWIEGEV